MGTTASFSRQVDGKFQDARCNIAASAFRNGFVITQEINGVRNLGNYCLATPALGLDRGQTELREIEGKDERGRSPILLPESLPAGEAMAMIESERLKKQGVETDESALIKYQHSS